MICKYCKNTIPDESVFCMLCGERVARKSKSAGPRYPKFRKLKEGFSCQIMVDGQREVIWAETERKLRAEIDARREKIVELKVHPEKRSLDQIVRAYIDKNDSTLSPATIRGYEIIYNNRFKDYMPIEAGKIDFQEMVNEEAKESAPKTVKNAWALISPALKDAGVPVPDVNLPSVPDYDGDFLDHDQIQLFLKAIRGDSCEAAALLMLHSLRMSELLKLETDDIVNGQIRIRGAVVPDKNNKFVEKKTNKNRTSSRTVPVMIPRLAEVLPAEGKIVTVHPSTIRTHIENACIAAGVPVCSPHDLRRSFASLGFHLQWSELAIKTIGGWSNMQTVHRIYVKLYQNDLNSDVNKMKNYYQITSASDGAP